MTWNKGQEIAKFALFMFSQSFCKTARYNFWNFALISLILYVVHFPYSPLSRAARFERNFRKFDFRSLSCRRYGNTNQTEINKNINLDLSPIFSVRTALVGQEQVA